MIQINYKNYYEKILKARQEYLFEGKRPAVEELLPHSRLSQTFVYGLVSRTQKPTLEHVSDILDIIYGYKRGESIDGKKDGKSDTLFDRSISDYSDEELVAELKSRNIDKVGETNLNFVDFELLDREQISIFFKMAVMEITLEKDDDAALSFVVDTLKELGYKGNISYDKKIEF